MIQVEEIDFFLVVLSYGGIEHYNERAVIGSSEEVGDAPARPDVDIATENAAVSHGDGHPMGIHFRHRFCPFRLRCHYPE